MHADENRAQYSALTVGTERQIEVTRESLARISARPVATVAAAMAMTRDSRQRTALRAEALDDELVKLSGISTVARGTRETDPVTVRLAEVTGYSDGAVAVVIGMTFSVLIELVGALLWYEALRHTDRGEGQSWNPNAADVTEGVTSPVETVTGFIKTEEPVIAGTSVVTTELSGQVAPVINAIKIGKCRPTVAGIRKYLGCSQARASELRRELVGMGRYERQL